MNVTPPRSKLAMLVYGAAALVAVSILADLWNAFAYTDHFNLWYQLRDLAREIPFVAMIVAFGVGVQYLADIRWLLIQQRGGKDA
jgi:hypothetical protein